MIIQGGGLATLHQLASHPNVPDAFHPCWMVTVTNNIGGSRYCNWPECWAVTIHLSVVLLTVPKCHVLDVTLMYDTKVHCIWFCTK